MAANEYTLAEAKNLRKQLWGQARKKHLRPHLMPADHFQAHEGGIKHPDRCSIGSVIIRHLDIKAEVLALVVSEAALDASETELVDFWIHQGREWAEEFQEHVFDFSVFGLKKMVVQFGEEKVKHAPDQALREILSHYFDVDPLYHTYLFLGPFEGSIDIDAIFQPGADEYLEKWAKYLKFLFVSTGVHAWKHILYPNVEASEMQKKEIAYHHFCELATHEFVENLGIGVLGSIPITTHRRGLDGKRQLNLHELREAAEDGERQE